MRAAAVLVQMNGLGNANLILVQCGRGRAIPNGDKNRLGGRSAFVSQEAFDRVPPAVLKARESLGLLNSSQSSSNAPGSSSSFAEVVAPCVNSLPESCNSTAGPVSCSKLTSAAPKLESSSRSAHVAGEPTTNVLMNQLARRRSAAPLLPAAPFSETKKRKASADLVLEIAGNAALAKQADEEFEELLLAASTVKVKNSMNALWVKICEARQIIPFPVSTAAVMQVASVMKAAGYRSIPAYLCQAKQMHIKQGFVWTDELDLAFKDAKRGALRGLGPPSRATVFPVSSLAKLPEVPVVELSAWPFARKLAWTLAATFLLREVELSTLSLSSEEVKLDEGMGVVTLKLSVSKSDPQAKGCSRSLACCCAKHGSHLCPFHVTRKLVAIQCHRTQRSQTHELAWQTPLIGRVDDPYSFVAKDAVVAALREDMSVLQVLGYLPEDFNIEGISGHSFRRSGAQQLALEGVPLDLIQHLARHSSQAILAYVDDALEKCPAAAGKLLEHFSLQEQIASLVTRVKTVAETLAEHSKSFDAAGLDEKRVQVLIRSFLRPGVVLNICTLKYHSCVGNQHLVSPADWTTHCGWSWVRAGRLTRIISAFDDLPPGATPCEKCKGSFPSWFET